MPYYVRMITDTDGLVEDESPYPTLDAALRVAAAPLKDGRAKESWIEDGNGKVWANYDDVKKHAGLA